MVEFDKLYNNKQLRIVDGMVDWVRVIDKNNIVHYANKKMKEDLGEEIVGKRCFEVLCRDRRCEDCLFDGTINEGSINRKETFFNNKTYTVISSPMFGNNDEIIGTVEVFRDITKEKELAKNINDTNKKMKNDLLFARNMQKRMLPPKGMYNDVAVNYLYEPSELLSGDFFDVFKVDNDNIGIYICDVVGHGVTASLLTIFVRQSLRTIAKGKNEPNKIISELHKTFLALNLDADKYFSLFFGIYNKETHEFSYVNAGHNSVPILLKGEDHEIIMLKAKGYPVCNIFDSVDYDVNKIKLKVKDKIFFYTDGITELRDEKEQEFGLERLIEIIKRDNNILKDLKSSLDEYSQSHKDDYAILIAEII